MTPNTRNVFHITSYEAMVKILDQGAIEPKASQGRRAVAWYVNRNLIPWAIAHVAQRHDLKIDQIVIMYVKADWDMMMKSSKNGVYCTTHKLKPYQIDSAPVWLQRQEKRIILPSDNVRRKARFNGRYQEEDELPEVRD